MCEAEEERNSEESDYSSIIVHTTQQLEGEASSSERVECDTEAGWLSMYTAMLRVCKQQQVKPNLNNNQ